jgi:hypothetical protein
VTSSWSIFIQQQDVHYISKGAHLYISTVKCQWLIERVLDLSLLFLGSYVNESALSTDCSLCQNGQYNITLQAMYVQRNIDARSCKHCCSGRAINITYSECVFVELGILHAMRLLLIVIYGLSFYRIFFHII